jgi:molybdenum cofactor biosynthesis enzyme MoaA
MSVEPASISLRVGPAPEAPFLALDTVWFQVAGTLCNLACRHCFISCGPTNRRHGMMTRAEVKPYLAEAETLGVKDFYFTGGEPFLNRELPGILEDALSVGPATILTNATLITAERARALARMESASRFALELRVSLDGLSPETNDPIRGEGSFDAAVRGLREVERAGLNPILTVARTWCDVEDAAMREAFHRFLTAQGFTRPRVKVLSMFRLGEEAVRTRGYTEQEALTEAHLRDFDLLKLQCTTSRMVTSRGVFVCPILIDAPDARLGKTLRDSMRPYALAHGACHTCWATGVTCRN